jgi:hypothetical protein
MWPTDPSFFYFTTMGGASQAEGPSFSVNLKAKRLHPDLQGFRFAFCFALF